MGASSAAGAKSTRACDYCIKTRARWYCAADDAFLCQSCDSSVHSANPVARRHLRVRLKTASHKHSLEISVPRWHRGFCRKARSLRQKKIAGEEATRVPENSGEEEESPVKNEAQFLYQVPSFDDGGKMGESSLQALNDFLHSDMDMDEFAVDVESLLGKGLENETFDMSELGIMDCERVVKVENEAIAEKTSDHQPEKPFELNSRFDSSITDRDMEYSDEPHDSNKVFLKLDYDGVLSSWGSKKSPWTTGERPDSNSAHCWLPDCTGCCGKMHGYEATKMKIENTIDDGGREAKVSRYREKRRTRLFSRKIRYEVRKLNAEKRPRMKGRFIKASN